MASNQADAGLLPGFGEPVRDSTATFRAVLDAMSSPGRVVSLGATAPAPAGLSPATVAVCLTLLDFETPLWLPDGLRGGDAERHLRFHCGCPVVDTPVAARFAVIAEPAEMPPLDAFHAGDDQFPERSATLIVQAGGLRAGEAGWRLTGPGIRSEARLAVEGLPPGFGDALRANTALYPLGRDFIFTCCDKVAALPRTTQVED
jgi:alpha-D-ribose 1-methylphosphonate 5-triphosphate synthase subunit PhnH